MALDEYLLKKRIKVLKNSEFAKIISYYCKYKIIDLLLFGNKNKYGYDNLPTFSQHPALC